MVHHTKGSPTGRSLNYDIHSFVLASSRHKMRCRRLRRRPGCSPTRRTAWLTRLGWPMASRSATQGEKGAAKLMRKLGPMAEVARDLSQQNAVQKDQNKTG